MPGNGFKVINNVSQASLIQMQMLYIASQLTYLAVVANFGSIITVLICCAAMILFIRQFRLHEFEPSVSSVVRIKQPAHEQLLTRVNLPFSLRIGKLNLNDSESHLVLNSTSYFPCIFFVCRDMSSDAVNSLVNEPWVRFLEILRCEVKSWPNLHLYSEEGVHEFKTFTVQNTYNDKPRSTYALVAFHVRTDEEYEDQDPAAIVTLIHLPDHYCTAPATILTQYLKCRDGRVLNLKPFYSSEEKKMTSEENPVNENFDQGNTNCVICWTSPTTHVLLPCRHACLCLNCFKRIDVCPVCRTRVVSFFLV